MALADDVKAVIAARSPTTTLDARVDTLVVLATGQLDATVFGTLYAYALALLVLHWLALDERGKGGASGPVTSEKEDTLARSYGGGTDVGYLKSTHWGSELLGLMKRKTFIPRTRVA